MAERQLRYLLVLVCVLLGTPGVVRAETVEGTVEVLVKDDFATHTSIVETYVATREGRRLLLVAKNAKLLAGLKPKDVIRVTGERTAREVSVGSVELVRAAPSSRQKLAGSPWTLGPKKVLAVMLNTSYDPRTPFAEADVRKAMGATAGFFSEVSYGARS